MQAFLSLLLLLPALALSLDPSSLLGAHSNSVRRRHPHLNSQRSTTARSHVSRRGKTSTFVSSDVRIPLTRLAVRASDDVHPLVALQQHINRGVRRHARMTKREEPTSADLRARLTKRVLSVETAQQHAALKKRGIRGGLAMSGMSQAVSALQSLFTNGFRVKGTKGGNGGGQGNQPASSSSNSSTSAGFSKAEFDAANQGTVTAPQGQEGTNSIGLRIEANEVGYFGTVQMGTPPRDFNILFDSGSADFWVPSQVCRTCGPHTVLGSKTSSSFADTGKQFQVTYGTGNVAGEIIQDDISVAGLTLKAHAFGVTTDESQEFGDASVPFDGLMGLAQSSLSNQGVPTPIEAMAAAGLVANAQVGYHLASVSDPVQDSQITFGGVDATKFTGTLVEFPNVNKQGFFEGALDGATVDGKDLGFQGRTAILDTGTTLIIMPAADAEALHAAIPGASSDGQGGFTIPCTTSSEVAFSFGGQSFAIPPQHLTFLPVSNDLQGDCISGISSGQIGGANEWLVGDTFLKSVYYATDVGSNSIGLAPSVVAQ